MSDLSRGLYCPLALDMAIRICRFANAEWMSLSMSNASRYQVSFGTSESLERQIPIWILDISDGSHVLIADMLTRLSPYHQEIILWCWGD
uniref:Uncharacterized protein n=1 Tax=Leviviridae sp. TaxID=2027243 RepID=A0A514D463_9VIRU|nr:MAG: hypothetical protein H2Rhizo311759_000002 [Leviviridae sp.]